MVILIFRRGINNQVMRPASFVILFLFFAAVLVSSAKTKPANNVHPDSLIARADKFLDKHQINQALPLLFRVVQDPSLKDDLVLQRKAHSNLGYSYYMLSKYDSSLIHYQKNLEINLALKDTARIVRTQKNIGMTYQKQGFLGQSLEAFNQAALLTEKLDDLPSLTDTYNSMALVHHSAGDMVTALSYHFRALEGWQVLVDSTNMAFSLNNIARCYHELLKYDSSLYYNFKSLEIKRRNTDSVSMASTINNIGTAYLALENLVEAEEYLNEAFGIYRKHKNQYGLVASFNNLADLSIRKGEFNKALAHLDSGANILDQFQSKELLVDLLELRVELMQKTERFEEALNSHKELAALNQELFQEEKLNVQKVESSFLLRQAELESQTADRETEFARADNRRYLQFIAILTLSVLVTGVLLALLFRFNSTLKLKNKIIESHQEDLRHRTYNILTRIQSLIRMASSNLTDEKSIQVMRNSEAAILSAAAIQEHLTYQDNSGRILIGKYLEDLVMRLEEMFQLTGQDISYKVEIREDVQLPVNTVLNLGMIIAELVTNAAKYAFNELSSDPEISVLLEMNNRHLQIHVRDNGVGIVKNHKEGTGSGLVRRLAGYIKAELNVSNTGGTLYILKLKL